MVKQFHNDYYDKLNTKQLLAKLKQVEQIEDINYKYHPFDLILITKKSILPIQIKNRLNYSIYQFDTLNIDATAYNDLIQYPNALLIVYYPKDKKILVYNKERLIKAYQGNIFKDVTSYSEKTKTWFKEKNKELSVLNISQGKIFDYEQFNINNRNNN